ncbi:MAG: AAA family ATPase [Patescibacteria group bacterium]|nr:AAA family ATPase [Patescibacteria group bacterium]
MYLKRLEIQGFKSFAPKTVMDFLPPQDGRFSVTAIVGPNGSGKSNIADAIRWVMGEQSMKAVRGKKSEDVIFSGSETKGQLGMAEVTMVLDNQDSKVLQDYPEIIITRRLYRSGESEYIINNNPVRLFDIHIILAQAQFAENSYGIVGQGMIDRMLLLSPSERKDFLDEAAGIKEFKIKRHQAELKLARTKDNMEQAERLMQEVEPRLKMLQRQVRKLEKRQMVELELREAQEKYYSSIYNRNKKDIDETQAALAGIENRHASALTALEAIQHELAELARSATRQEVFLDLQSKYQEAQRAKNEIERRQAILDGQMHAEYSQQGAQNITWLTGKINELKFSQEKITSELAGAEEAVKKMNEEIWRQKKKVDDRTAEKTERMVKISRLQSQMIEGQSEQSFLQFSGLTAVRAVLEARSTLGKIHGIVAELGETDERYRLALDVAAGSHLSSVVVESDEVARVGINYLREKRLGIATFLPINKITERPEDTNIEELLSDPDVLGRATDLIHFDAKFKNIFSFILGNTLVVKDLKSAQRIGIGRARMVTLDGDLVDRRGVMKGGWRERRHQSLSFSTKVFMGAEDRLKESQRELTLEQQNLLETERMLEEAKRELQKLEVEIQSNEAKTNLLKNESQNLDKAKAGLERELALLQMTPEQYGEKLKELSGEKERLNADMVKQEKIVNELALKIQSFNQEEETKKQRVFSLQEAMQTKQLEMNAVGAERNDLRVQMARLETKQESLAEEVRNDMNTSLDSIVGRRQEMASAEELELLAANIQKLKYQLNLIGGIDEEVIKEFETTKERFDFLFSQLNDLRQATDDLTKMIIELDELMKTKRSTAFRNIRKEFNRFFKILFEGGSADLMEVYEEEALEEEALAGMTGETPAEESEPASAPKELRLATPERQRGERGKGEKILAGIEVTANPPGKKIKSLNSLSGGERTLTSIALICAVLNYNPSPFVVLDEVEAALDEANTMRFTKIISELARHAQFILITHNRVTMHAVDALYGVAMAADGVSKLLSVKMTDEP